VSPRRLVDALRGVLLCPLLVCGAVQSSRCKGVLIDAYDTSAHACCDVVHVRDCLLGAELQWLVAHHVWQDWSINTNQALLDVSYAASLVMKCHRRRAQPLRHSPACATPRSRRRVHCAGYHAVWVILAAGCLHRTCSSCVSSSSCKGCSWLAAVWG
jgi:hypothetical protein